MTSSEPVSGPVAAWSAIARAHAEQVTEGALPLRVAVVGTAGGGKSSLLRHLCEALAGLGHEVVPFRSDAPASAASVVVVDDAHLLDDDDLRAVLARAEDPDAGLIVACRPWPQPDPLRDVIAFLERAQPSIVLGRLTRDDVAAILAGAEVVVPEACIDDVVEQTAGIPWLLIEALTAHTALPDGHPASHEGLGEALQDLVAHRVRTIDPELRAAVEVLCLLPVATHDVDAETLDAGHAAGLLTRSGRPAPVVRDAVRATTPLDRIVALATTPEHDADPDVAAVIHGIRDERIASSLQRRGDRLATAEPHDADAAYRSAADAGADPVTIALRRAVLAWHAGDTDAACALVEAETVPPEHPDREQAADIVAAAWAARGQMATSAAIYAAIPISSAEVEAHRVIAAAATGDREGVDRDRSPAASAIPTTVSVSMDLLVRGMRASVVDEAATALHDLVAAAEMYSASGASSPMPELPAVLAAQAAIGVGELDVADSVLGTALGKQHGGAWAQRRLLLWRAWVALQRQHPRDAEHALAVLDADGGVEALDADAAIGPRDRLLADAIRIALARRYSDAAGLAAAWHRARETTLRADFDLFTALPLAEFVTAAARVDDLPRVDAHFARALTLLDALGGAAVWGAHLRWAGIQKGIQRGDPASLTPHARALVAAAPRNRVAGHMAQAGRVWTSVLGGAVDVDAVEESARGLAAVGLAWDGARLASHGAGHAKDRRDIARLLAVARQLHPRDRLATEPPSATESTGVGAPSSAPAPPPGASLSAREREVAALVVQGKTYAEIGERIYISPRTAEHHIARIRQRLGATTRSDLIAKLRVVLEHDVDPHALTPSTTPAP